MAAHSVHVVLRTTTCSLTDSHSVTFSYVVVPLLLCCYVVVLLYCCCVVVLLLCWCKQCALAALLPMASLSYVGLVKSLGKVTLPLSTVQCGPRHTDRLKWQ